MIPLGILAAQVAAFLARDVAVAHSDSPFVSAYPFSAGFGTKYADPAVLPTGTGRNVALTK